MRLIVSQVAFLAAYLAFLILVRQSARERLQRRADDEQARREALEREWRVGIPYDPEPEESVPRRR